MHGAWLVNDTEYLFLQKTGAFHPAELYIETPFDLSIVHRMMALL